MKIIIKFIFNRLTLTLIFLTFQIFFIVAIIFKYKKYFIFFYLVNMVVSIILMIVILNKDDKPAYKFSWIILILIFPICGSMFYIFFGNHNLNKHQKHKIKLMENKIRTALPPQKCIFDKISMQNDAALNQSKYIQNYAFCPPYTNTTTEYLPSGEVKFKKLKEELAKAERFIFLECNFK